MIGPGSTLPHVDNLKGFWEAVREANHRCLLLDYDGTLSPLVHDRLRAYPLDGIVELLTAIRDTGKTFLSIMTGRPLEELLLLLGDLGIPMSGSQGTEFRYPGGRWYSLVPSASQRKRLSAALAEAREAAPEERIETKPASIALHTRGLAPSEAERLEDRLASAWSVGAESAGLVCRRFNGGVELRLADVDKAGALEKLLEDEPVDSLCIYVGDDDTDEDAFGALGERGVGIRVCREPVSTSAQARLRDPEDVRTFLSRWLDITGGRR